MELIERLLAGERLDTAELGYELDANHLGLLVSGPGAERALAALARSLDARLLCLPRPEGVLWAWLGQRSPLDPKEAQRLVEELRPRPAAIALGEPGEGAEGWRLTHRQARAALAVALRSPEAVTRYADVALLASVLQDELLATSLRRIYLEPLETERDGGEVLRETLRAYFAAGRNVSSAAIALNINRRTLSSRLGTAETLIGRPLEECASELQMALRLDELDGIRAG